MGLVGRSTVGLILAMNEWFAQGGGIGKFAVALGPSCCRCGFFFFFFLIILVSLFSRPCLIHLHTVILLLFRWYQVSTIQYF